MNSIEFLSCIFQLVEDLKAVHIVRLEEDSSLYCVNIILDLEGDEEDE